MDCGHEETTCADVCQQVVDEKRWNTGAGSTQDGGTGILAPDDVPELPAPLTRKLVEDTSCRQANLPGSQRRETLPLDLQRVVFTTEGHTLLLWDSLRTRKRRDRSRAPVSQASGDNESGERDSTAPASESRVAPTEGPDSAARARRGATEIGAEHNSGYPPAASSSSGPIQEQQSTADARALDLLSRAVGNYYALTGTHTIRFECNAQGSCNVAGLSKETGDEPPLHVGLTVPADMRNRTSRALDMYNLARDGGNFPMKGSRALFGPSLVDGDPVHSISVEHLWIATPSTPEMYYGCISDWNALTRRTAPLPPRTAVLLFRGHCSFVDKVRAAQSIGADVAIIVDQTAWLPDSDAVAQTQSEIESDQQRILQFLRVLHSGGKPSMSVFLAGEAHPENIEDVTLFSMADDETGSDIAIPSVFLTRADGVSMIEVLSRCFEVDDGLCTLALNVSAGAKSRQPQAAGSLNGVSFPISALAKVGILPKNLMQQLGSDFASEIGSTVHTKEQTELIDSP